MRPGPRYSGSTINTGTLVGTFISIAVSLIVFTTVVNKAGQFATKGFEPAAEQAIQQTALIGEYLFIIFVVIPIAGLTILFILSVAADTYDRITDRKQYPITTVAVATPFVTRERADSVDCLICDLEDEPGYEHVYGRETVVLGVVVHRREEGRNQECVTCRSVDAVEQSLRAERTDPVSVVDELDMTPQEAHDAVEEVTA